MVIYRILGHIDIIKYVYYVVFGIIYIYNIYLTLLLLLQYIANGYRLSKLSRHFIQY